MQLACCIIDVELKKSNQFFNFLCIKVDRIKHYPVPVYILTCIKIGLINVDTPGNNLLKEKFTDLKALPTDPFVRFYFYYYFIRCL